MDFFLLSFRIFKHLVKYKLSAPVVRNSLNFTPIIMVLIAIIRVSLYLSKDFQSKIQRYSSILLMLRKVLDFLLCKVIWISSNIEVSVILKIIVVLSLNDNFYLFLKTSISQMPLKLISLNPFDKARTLWLKFYETKASYSQYFSLQ